jgi:hypothetical protein
MTGAALKRWLGCGQHWSVVTENTGRSAWACPGARQLDLMVGLLSSGPWQARSSQWALSMSCGAG